jgi:tRNA threonylcarbamoyladenosine dehydratase
VTHDAAFLERFVRTRLLLGNAACHRLAQARVVVVGLGAVGSYACEALARCGVGRLRLVDFDTVRPSNINRQLYALDSTIGKQKVELAAARVRDINPACEVEILSLFVDSGKLDPVLGDRPDAVIDAIDSLGPKLALLEAAAKAGLFIVSSMGAATRLDFSQVRLGDLSETDVCPLARRIRKNLKKRGVVSGLRCVYSTEPVPEPALDLELDAAAADPEPHQRGRPRKPLGSVAFLTGIFGLVAAGEVVRHLAATPVTKGKKS